MSAPRKKAVYVRGPDGVYRQRPGLATSGPPTKPATTGSRDEPPHLGYHIPSAPTGPPHAESQHPPADQSDSTSHTGTSDTDTFRSLPSLNISRPVSPRRAVSPARLASPRRRPALPIKGPMESSSHESSPYLWQDFMSHLEPYKDKAIPFVLGMCTTYALQLALPTISYYTTVAVGLVKWTLLVVSIAGAAFWYLGTLNSTNISASLETVTDYILARSRRSSVDSDVTTPHTASLLEPSPQLDLKPRLDPRQSVTNVRPFIAPSRDPLHKTVLEQKLPQKAVRLTERSYLEMPYERKDLQASGSSRKTGPYPSSPDRRKSLTSVESANKPLPPLDDGLPMAHEVKLLDVNLSRSDTLVSKKSVLGTRANYSRFLANVEST